MLDAEFRHCMMRALRICCPIHAVHGTHCAEFRTAIHWCAPYCPVSREKTVSSCVAVSAEASCREMRKCVADSASPKMRAAANLPQHVCNRGTPIPDVRWKLIKLHRFRLQRRRTLIAHAAPQCQPCRHRFRNKPTHRLVQRAAATAATPEASVTFMRIAVIVLCTCASMLCIATIFLVKVRPSAPSPLCSAPQRLPPRLPTLQLRSKHDTESLN